MMQIAPATELLKPDQTPKQFGDGKLWQEGQAIGGLLLGSWVSQNFAADIDLGSSGKNLRLK